MKSVLTSLHPTGRACGLLLLIASFARAQDPAPAPPGEATQVASLTVTNTAAAVDDEVLRTALREHPWTVAMPHFEAWPVPPAYKPKTNAPAAGAEPAPTPAASARDKQLYSFHAENMELKTALALFAKANNLNIVPDHDVSGQVTLDVHDLPLPRIMQALLEAYDIGWTEQDGLIRVRATETRSYVVNYLRLTRTGQGSSSVTLSSSSSGGVGGGQGGGGAGGGGGGGQGGQGGGGNSSMSQMQLDLKNPVEFWRELEEQIRKILSPAGRESLAVNMTAGVVQVTDRPSAIKRLDSFISQMTDSVARQVDIEAKLYDVTLGNQFQFGIDWQRAAMTAGGSFGSLGTPFGNLTSLATTNGAFITPGGGFQVKPSAITLLFSNQNTTAILQALEEQGNVSVISQPRLRTLNNQTAIMKVGTDQTFFTQFSQTQTGGGAVSAQSGEVPTTITVGTVLAVTPQIASTGWITLDITPAITSLAGETRSPSGNSSAPVLDIKQSSTVVRLRDGETIVMGGLIQNSTGKSTRKVPWVGDIPGIGKLFQGKVEAKAKKELVIFLTPRIVAE